MPAALKIDWNSEHLLRQVQGWAALGAAERDIGPALGCSRETFQKAKRRHKALQDAYQAGKAQGRVWGMGRLRKLIEEGNCAALIFFLKTQARWSEHHSVDVKANIDARIKLVKTKDQVLAEWASQAEEPPSTDPSEGE